MTTATMPRPAVLCDCCQTPLTGGRDTFGGVGENLCYACFFAGPAERLKLGESRTQYLKDLKSELADEVRDKKWERDDLEDDICELEYRTVQGETRMNQHDFIDTRRADFPPHGQPPVPAPPPVTTWTDEEASRYCWPTPDPLPCPPGWSDAALPDTGPVSPTTLAATWRAGQQHVDAIATGTYYPIEQITAADMHRYGLSDDDYLPPAPRLVLDGHDLSHTDDPAPCACHGPTLTGATVEILNPGERPFVGRVNKQGQVNLRPLFAEGKRRDWQTIWALFGWIGLPLAVGFVLAYMWWIGRGR